MRPTSTTFSVPLDGFGVVLRHTFAIVVHHAEEVLPFGMALVGRFAVPLDGLGMVLGDTFAPFVHLSKVELGPGMALPGSLVDSGKILFFVRYRRCHGGTSSLDNTAANIV